MITGIVNADFEPIISLSICGADGKVYTQEAIIDTGFNGWLSLPPDSIAELNLKWKKRGRAILGDGTECVFDVYYAAVLTSCFSASSSKAMTCSLLTVGNPSKKSSIDSPPLR